MRNSGRAPERSGRRGFEVGAAALLLLVAMAAQARNPKKAQTSLRDFIERVQERPLERTERASAGSLWRPDGLLADLASDYKARRVGDTIVIQIVEQVQADTSGNVTSQRDFKAESGLSALAGQINTKGVEQLFSPHSSSSLQGKAQSTAKSTLRTVVAGRVVAVLPSGNLVIEATRDVLMNNQRQTILLRGLVRPGDVSPANTVASTSLSNLELELKGKGVVSDGTRPPNFLVRLLLRLVGF